LHHIHKLWFCLQNLFLFLGCLRRHKNSFDYLLDGLFRLQVVQIHHSYIDICFRFRLLQWFFCLGLKDLLFSYILYKIFQKYHLKNNRKQFLNHLCRLQNNIHFEKLYIFSQLDTQNSLINFQKYLFENLFLPNQIHFVFAD